MASAAPALTVRTGSGVAAVESATTTSASGKETSPTQKKDSGPGRDPEPGPSIIPPIEWGGERGKDYKLTVRGDTRIRGERRENYRGAIGTTDDDTLAVVRTRVNAELLHRDAWRGFLELLDARGLGVADGDMIRSDAPWQFHQGYLEYRDPAIAPWSFRAGRQEIALGRERRLVQAAGWSNIRRNYDGVRGMFRTEDLEADLWFTRINTNDRVDGSGNLYTDSARPRPGEYFYGGHFIFRHWSPHTLELALLGQSDRQPELALPSPPRGEKGDFGTLTRYTLGMTLAGPLRKEDNGEWLYGLEGAIQRGHRTEDDIRAHMLHADITRRWNTTWKPSLRLEGNLASGDRDPNDGVAGTFNPVYGRGHGPYGIMDLWRLQNVREVGLIGQVEPKEGLRATVEYHYAMLDESRDAWYDNSGRNLGRDRTGNSGRGLGHEISAVLQWRANKTLLLEGGAARYYPTDFARTITNGSPSNFLYVQTTIFF